MSTPQSLQARLEDLMLRSGRSARAISRCCRLKSPTHFGLLMKGERPNPSAETLDAIASTFRTTVAYLLRGEGKAPSDRQIKLAIAEAERALEASKAAA